MLHRNIIITLLLVTSLNIVGGNGSSKKNNNPPEITFEEFEKKDFNKETITTLILDENNEKELIYNSTHKNTKIICKFCYALKTYGVEHLKKNSSSPKEISGYLTTDRFTTQQGEIFAVISDENLVWLQQNSIIVTYNQDTNEFSDTFGKITIEGTNLPTLLNLQLTNDMGYRELSTNTWYERINERSFKKID